ncbi:hypothetical protein [Trichlorobacter lovleyi]|uniref:hypothetical protein n=1 Tax=Trichlorobacter lovleyi TaxID=313985 RepID=UPI002FDD6070
MKKIVLTLLMLSSFAINSAFASSAVDAKKYFPADKKLYPVSILADVAKNLSLSPDQESLIRGVIGDIIINDFGSDGPPVMIIPPCDENSTITEIYYNYGRKRGESICFVASRGGITSQTAGLILTALNKIVDLTDGIERLTDDQKNDLVYWSADFRGVHEHFWHLKRALFPILQPLIK